MKACREFQQEVEEEGYFETSYKWYFMKTGVSYCMLAITIYLFLKGKATQNEWIQVGKQLQYDSRMFKHIGVREGTSDTSREVPGCRTQNGVGLKTSGG